VNITQHDKDEKRLAKIVRFEIFAAIPI